MFNPFRKKVRAIHEPLELQIADVKRMSPLVVDLILSGENCDILANGQGEFGSINNPIPTNGLLGTIKYLGKLRGKTGHAVFFHRIGSFKSTATKNPVDKYELVCLDNTQWNYLFFDLYHPRRSNKCPIGYSFLPFNETIKIDNPIAFGVDYLVSDFPYGLVKELDKYYGLTGTMERQARKWLEQYKFAKPTDEEDKQLKDASSIKASSNKEKKEIVNSPLEIKHYNFISGVINEILALEKELIKSDKSNLHGFSCPQLFDKRYHVRFMIERFLFLSSIFRTLKITMNLKEMNNYINSIAMKEYDILNSESLNFMENRIQFYERELEMLSTFKHPHPGKIIWSLYNPSCKDVSDDLESMFEPNIIAGYQLLHLINETFSKEFKDYESSLNTNQAKDNNSDAIALFNDGIKFEKSGEYEKALECFNKAQLIDNSIENLTLHIQISRFWLGDFDITKEFENLYEYFTIGIEKNPNYFELLETRAWLCVSLLTDFVELDENKIEFLIKQSELDFTKCISLAPQNSETYKSRAFLYKSIEEYSKALSDINKAIELSPNYSRNYKERASIYCEMGLIDNSYKDIEFAISISEDDRWKREYINFREKIKTPKK